jgi:tetratricopeptide (TPR) repeat protein
MLRWAEGLASANPEAFLPNVASTLNNLAVLYSDTQRLPESEAAYEEALDIRRKLASANPEAFLPDVAMTLNNLGFFYYHTLRPQEAYLCCGEAEQMLLPFWRANPEAHGNAMARIFWTIALVHERLGNMREGCDYARKALTTTYEPDVREVVQSIIVRTCGGFDTVAIPAGS